MGKQNEAPNPAPPAFEARGPGRSPETSTTTRLPLDRIAAALRRERTRAGLSLSELAKRAGIAKSTLSQLEAANGKPGLETLWALSVALDVPPSVLLDPPRATVHVIRAGQGPAVPSEVANYSAALLSASPPGARRDLYFLQVEPGSPRDSDAHSPGTTEHLIVATGRVLAGPTEDPVELAPGDYLSYPGDAPHTCRALEPGTTCVLVMQHT
ncbi:helix-turn-helix domain-containing protein [Streptomyces sp. BH106]|uniref:helix-turn-helix domain-containing protein n=1 Tax=Streptomyces sp. BH106 TaxID=3410409 RepID=UPI003CF1298A